MNLLELMLKEEVEWPVVAEFAVQDDDGKIRFAIDAPVCNAKYYQWEGCLAGHGFDCGKKLEKWDETIITREEYQAAGGWMKWEGGECPTGVAAVEYVMRDKSFSSISERSVGLRWNHKGEASDITAYRIINQRPVQLDNPEIEPDFEPFVSIEDAQECKAEHGITPSKYARQIHGVSVDVYDVLMAWGVTNPALQHLIKKALQCGQRGHKDKQQDLQDIIDSAIRAKELEQDA